MGVVEALDRLVGLDAFFAGNCEPAGGHALRGVENGSGREQLGHVERESREHVVPVEHVRSTQDDGGER